MASKPKPPTDTLPEAADEDALRSRIAELESRETEHARSEQLQGALFRIAEAASAASDLQAFYREVHATVGTLMSAENFYIALYDDQRKSINFPYYVDSVDPDIPDPNLWEPFGVGNARGSTAYVLRTGRPAIINPERHAELVAQGELELVGVVGKGDWLGAPLKADGQTVGVVVCQTYEDMHYTEADRDLLAFVGQHIGSALSRVRAIEGTRQRNDELALINEIGAALAKQLDFDSIVELVGKRISTMFTANSMYVSMYDRATGRITFPYELHEGRRVDTGTLEYGSGLTSIVIDTGQPLLIQTLEESIALGRVEDGLDAESWLGVPIRAGDRVLGVIALESLAAHAYSDADVRLLGTLASSMGVALENARLFDETRRLLDETNDRAAELSVINEIGAALARQLEFQAIIDLVGERVGTIFESRSLFIALHDPERDILTFPYDQDEGQPFERGEFKVGSGLTSTVLRSGRSLRIGSIEEQMAAGALQVGGSDTQSWLGAPIPAGSRVIGVIGLESLQPDAFTEADERLLNTLSASLGVALENARLFDETKHLLAETDQRAAELAVINEIGSALAQQLEFQSIVDLVGERVRSIFNPQSMFISLYDPATNIIAFPYASDAGIRDELRAPRELGPGLTSRIIQTGHPVRVGSDAEANVLGAIQVGGSDTESFLGVPIMSGDRVTGVVALEQLEKDAFSETDERLLSTLATSMGVALENARLFDETKRLLAETNERAAELALINDVQHGLAQKLDVQAMYDLVGDRIQAIFDAQIVDIGVVDEQAGLVHFLYWIERGVRFPDEPMSIVGPRRYVLETREPLLINDNLIHRVEELGQQLSDTSGEPAMSALWVPLVVGDQARGVISLQNIDRENAFSESDVDLLRTLAASLSVALENVRLIDETRQRVTELATVNELGQAVSSQLDLGELIELVGEQMRRTFEADICYVALHNIERDEIEFPYFNEFGQQTGQEPFPFGQGLTSRIISEREPLLLNRESDWEALGTRGVGTASKSFLGVPIVVGDRAIGAISVQSTQREGRFGEADVRLLSTIAANVGVAIQNARLFQEAHRRADEMSALAEVGQEISATLDVQAVLERIGDRVRELLSADTVALFLADAEPGTYRAILAQGELADALRADTILEGEGIVGDVIRRRTPEFVNDTDADPRTVNIPGTDDYSPSIERLMAAPLIARDRVTGVAAVWRSEGSRSARPTSTSSSAWPGRPRSRSRTPGSSRRLRRPRPRPRAPTRPRARSSPR